MKRKWRPAARRLCAAGRPDMMRFVCLALLIAASASKAFSQQGIITTIAGGGANSPVALSAYIAPSSVAVDSLGNIFIASSGMHEVLRVDPLGNLTQVAGTGAGGFTGDGGPAASASLSFPSDVAVDAQGNLFIADSHNQRVRRVDATTGIITTVAGSGQRGYSGDGGPATSASFDFPDAVAVDARGNLFIWDNDNHRIRRVDVVTGIVTTVAGNGTYGYSGDGGPATSASIFATGVAVDSQGNLFISDPFNERVRRIDAVTGIITTVAGNGTFGYSGDGGPATSASLEHPYDVAVDAQDNLLIADTYHQRIRRVDAVTQIITTVAGNGQRGYSGDGGPATSASLAGPLSVAVDGLGSLFIADSGNSRIRRVDAVTGIISTVAGGGNGGDGVAATSAILASPFGVAPDSSGNVFIVERGNSRIRRVDVVTGIITTVAGNGQEGCSGDGGPATSASLGLPEGLALDAQGNLFIVDSGCLSIRRVDAVTGTITTVAGGSLFSGVAVDAEGNLFIADPRNSCILHVDVVSGNYTNVAGNGVVGYGGDGGPATSASFAYPKRVAVDTQGNLFVVDVWNGNVRRIDAVTGIITTVIGGFNSPTGVAVDAQGNLFISDSDSFRICASGPGNNRIWRVDAVTGIRAAVAGDGSYGYSGDGGPATAASLGFLQDVAVDAQGTVFIAGSTSNRVRAVPLPAFLALSPTVLPFSTQLIGTTSAAQTITLTNTGVAGVTISGIAIAGANADEYAQANTCASSLEAGANCAINVTFTPAAAGWRTATLTITDDAFGSPHTVWLRATGLDGDFSLAASPTSAAVTAGQSASYTITVSPVAGFNHSVALSCGGAPYLATCSVSTSLLTLDGTNTATATVTVTTTARAGVGMRLKPPAGPWIWLWMLGLFAAVGARLVAGRRLAWRQAWASLAVAMLSLTLWTACGGGAGSGDGNPGTPAGTYTLTVGGTYRSDTTTLQHSVNLTLKVN